MRLKKPIIKEVSLAINPVNNKKFIFLKEEVMENEELKNINDKINSLLETKDKEDFEKAADPLKVVSKKIDKLIEKKGEDKKTIMGILDSIQKIITYLEISKKGSYPKPDEKVKKDEGDIEKDVNEGLIKAAIANVLSFLKKNKAPAEILDAAQKVSTYLKEGAKADYGSKPKEEPNKKEDEVKKDELVFSLEEVKNILKEAIS